MQQLTPQVYVRLEKNLATQLATFEWIPAEFDRLTMDLKCDCGSESEDPRLPEKSAVLTQIAIAAKLNQTNRRSGRAVECAGLENRLALNSTTVPDASCDESSNSLPPSLPPDQSNKDAVGSVMLPTADGFMEWQEAPELAELINAWFDLPRHVIDSVMLLVRAAQKKLDI